VVDVKLNARSPLNGHKSKIGQIEIEEETGFALVNVAVARGGEHVFADTVSTAYGITPPAPLYTVSAPNGAHFIWIAPSTYMVRYRSSDPRPELKIAKALGDAAYVTDQSDAWVAVRLRGPTVCAALERGCMLDLHPVNFAVGMAQRTQIEHMNVIVTRETEERFLCLSASSSAQSLLLALEVSATNIA